MATCESEHPRSAMQRCNSAVSTKRDIPWSADRAIPVVPNSRFVAKARASAAPLGTAEALGTAVALHPLLAAPAARSLARSSAARCACMS
eukprot:scaffold43208_cov74-Phaeocystis_antarctica.AAC.3